MIDTEIVRVLLVEDDLNDNKNIGAHGGRWIIEKAPSSSHEKINVLTHCNTG